MNFKKLKEPFPAADIEWRIGRSGDKDGKPWATCLAYVTNRAIMDRLDEVAGPENWKNQFDKGPEGGIICGISIKCGDEWVTKWDGAENTDIEAIKGGLSNSMKRAAVQWGIGRYLYNLEEGFADIHHMGAFRAKTKSGISFRWNPPALPAWAIPAGDSTTPAPIRSDEAPEPAEVVKDPAIVATFTNACTIEELQLAWKDVCDNLTREHQLLYAADKDAAKARIQANA